MSNPKTVQDLIDQIDRLEKNGQYAHCNDYIYLQELYKLLEPFKDLILVKPGCRSCKHHLKAPEEAHRFCGACEEYSNYEPKE